jgi:hypothetical protein
MTDQDLVPVLQTAIGPVILISGVGFLLLTMTNRLSRIIDRARELSGERPGKEAITAKQLEILWARARLVRKAILLAAFGILCAALLVIVLFMAALAKVELAWLIISLFIADMICLISSLTLFIKDVNKSLEALKIELG